MNKKASSQIEKIISITLILVVLFVIYIFLPQNILDAGKEFYDNIFGKDELIIDYTEVDNTAQKSFDIMIQDIEACKNTKTNTQNQCLCSVNLNAFYSFYELSLEPTQITLLNTKSSPPLQIKQSQTPSLNCYIDEKGKENPLETLKFEIAGEPYLIKKKSFKREEKIPINPKKHNLINIGSKICWLLEKTPKTNFDICAI